MNVVKGMFKTCHFLIILALVGCIPTVNGDSQIPLSENPLGKARRVAVIGK
jgi:hypothetical protein